MTKLERQIVELFRSGKSVDTLQALVGFPHGLDVQSILRKALLAQDKKKGCR